MTTPAFRQFVFKIHSRCNLSCDYCYVYESVDQSWRRRPRSVDDTTVRTLGRRIAEHAHRHHLDRVHVTLHGGEPLLVGHDGLRRIVTGLRGSVAGATELDISLQTNGILLDEEFADIVLAERIRVGISLDGGREAHDRHRRYAHGGGSYDDVLPGIELMSRPELRPLFAGILATIDPANDPVQLYRDLAGLRPGRTDLLLPHATWENRPPAALESRTVYGDWLVVLFDTWYDAEPVIGVRIFEELMHALLGGASRTESVGLSAPDSIVVETDGSYELSDVLKVTYEGAAATGLDVFRHSVDDVLAHPQVVDRWRGLSTTCAACPIVAACGGGLYAHRYRPGNGFDNPSVYCHDLGRLIGHIDGRMQADLASRRAGSG